MASETTVYLEELAAASAASDNKAIILACSRLLGQDDLTRAQRLKTLRERGLARFAFGHHDGAIDDFSRSLEIDPVNAAALSNRGAARYEKGQYDAALGDFTHSLDLSPVTDTFIWIGVVKTALDDLQGARQVFEQALARDPRHITLLKWHAHTCNNLEDRAAALADLNLAIEIAPTYSDLHKRKGFTLSALERYEEAVQAFDEALRLEPEDAATLTSRADAKEAAGDLDGAAADYGRALEIDPEHFGVRHARMWLLHKLNRPAEAVKEADNLIEHYPQSTYSFWECGKLCWRAGDFGRARHLFGKAFEASPYDRAAVAEYIDFLKERGDLDAMAAVFARLDKLGIARPAASESDGSAAEKPSYTCCFCGSAIDRSERGAIEIAARNLWQRDDPPVQALFAHSGCLESRFHPDIPFDADILSGETATGGDLKK